MLATAARPHLAAGESLKASGTAQRRSIRWISAAKRGKHSRFGLPCKLADLIWILQLAVGRMVLSPCAICSHEVFKPDQCLTASHLRPIQLKSREVICPALLASVFGSPSVETEFSL